MERPQVVCATVAVGTAKKEGEGTQLMNYICGKVYDACRSNPGTNHLIPEFPDFGPLLSQLSASSNESRTAADYQVTVLHPSGALVIKESFMEQFGQGDNEIKEFLQVCEEHNEKYNREGVRLAQESAPRDGNEPQPTSSVAVALVQNDATLNAEYLAKLELSKPQRLHVVKRQTQFTKDQHMILE